MRRGRLPRDRVRPATGDLHLQGLTKRFGATLAVDEVTLTVPRGCFFAILGPSGCGKSTLLRLVAGLEQPTAGRVLIGDTDLTETRPFERPVNTVFQSYALFPHLSVLDNVAFGPRRRGIPDAAHAAEAALALVRLQDIARRRPAQLSGGQQQRVALARALVNRPQVLLLDEPLAALDLTLRRDLQLELKRIQSEVGTTFLHVTHDQEEAMTLADTIAVLRAGRIEQLGPPEELYDRPRTSFVAGFLGRANLLAVTDPGRAHPGRAHPGSAHPGSTDSTAADSTAADSTGVELLVTAGGRRLRLSRNRIAPGDGPLTFGVRPEKTRLHTHDPGPERAGCSLGPGTVADVSFLGVARHYLVDVPAAGKWAVHEQNLDLEPIAARPGDQVWLSWEAGHAFGVRS